MAELALKAFIDPKTTLPHVKSIIIAGSSGFKNELVDALDQRLKSCVAKVVDIQYGGLMGFQEAMSKTSTFVNNLPLMEMEKNLQTFFTNIEKVFTCFLLNLFSHLKKGQWTVFLRHERNSRCFGSQRHRHTSSP